METGSFKMQRLAGLADTLFAGAEGPKVLGRLRASIREEFDFDSASRLVADADVQEDLRIHGVYRGFVRGLHHRAVRQGERRREETGRSREEKQSSSDG
jgi:hypothetical protein